MNIFEKIAEVMTNIGSLEKDLIMNLGNRTYKVISEEKVTSSVRNFLNANGIVIIPIEQQHKREGTLTTVDVKYRIQSKEDPEDFVIAVSSGTGVDTQDKGVGMAMTYAYKYLLLRLFAIPTGDDPDKTSSEELDQKFQYHCTVCGEEVKAMNKSTGLVDAKTVYEGFGKKCKSCWRSEKAKKNKNE